MEINYREDVLLARISRVIDETTGKEICLKFTYANDTTGEYRYIASNGHEVTSKGRIKIVERPLKEKRTPIIGKDKAIKTILKKLRPIDK